MVRRILFRRSALNFHVKFIIYSQFISWCYC